MLATLVRSLPRHGDWRYEYKWDGYRALASWDGRQLRLRSRSDRDILPEFPELARLGAALPGPAILDGEIVALDAHGRPSFNALQNRMSSPRPEIVYLLFDVLHLGGASLIELPYVERRERLDALRLRADHWQTPPIIGNDGERALRSARERRLEGVLAKRAASRYLPGPRRSEEWLKLKLIRREEFVVGGWLPGSESFTGLMGSLLLGWYERPGKLRYAGKVGTGFSLGDRAAFRRALASIASDTSPFATPIPRFPQPTHFCQPRLVAEVEFTELTPEGFVRHPAFVGLRTDKRAEDVGDPRPRGTAGT
jgi:bifunctional non-homologous end joining protein LigD